jgi:Undecaprenyl-phosphate glucose phosphotransferase
MHYQLDRPHRLIPDSFIEELAKADDTNRQRKVKEIQQHLLRAAPLMSRRVIAGLVRLAEGVTFALAAVVAYVAYVAEYGAFVTVTAMAIVLVSCVGYSIFAAISGLYKVTALLHPAENLSKLYFCVLSVFAIMFAGLFFTKYGGNISRVWLGSWFVLAAGLLTVLRFGAASIVRHWNANGQLDRRAVLIGGGKPAADLMEALEASHDVDIQVIGIFDDRDDERSPVVVSGVPKLGMADELADFVRKTRVDLLIVTLPVSAEKRLLEVLMKLWILPVDIRLSAYTQQLRYRPRAYSYIGNLPFLDVFDKPLSDWDVVFKSIEDRIISAIAILALLPVMAVTALAIKLESKGPVLFRQKRYGFNNELIEIYKFRSMYTDQCDATASKLVTRDDPRVTRVGKFIRRTSIDELPQLFNVLKGELSLVGPRPHATQAKARDSFYEEVVEGYFARHKVKPGITGWAQVNGWRGETDTVEKIQRRVEHDLYYIENWSVAMDLYILFKTPLSLVTTKAAY